MANTYFGAGKKTVIVDSLVVNNYGSIFEKPNNYEITNVGHWKQNWPHVLRLKKLFLPQSLDYQLLRFAA